MTSLAPIFFKRDSLSSFPVEAQTRNPNLESIKIDKIPTPPVAPETSIG